MTNPGAARLPESERRRIEEQLAEGFFRTYDAYDPESTLRALLASEQAAWREVERLRNALEEFGEHSVGCNDARSYDRTLPCRCGFDDALRGAAHQ